MGLVERGYFVCVLEKTPCGSGTGMLCELGEGGLR